MSDPIFGSGIYGLLFQIAQNTAGIAPVRGDGVYQLAYKIAQNTAGTLPRFGDSMYDLFYKIAGNTAGTSPKPTDRIYDLLYKIAGNFGGKPVFGDGMYGLFFKTAGGTAGGGPSLDSDAASQKARIEADGGVVTDAVFLSNLIADLKTAGCYTLLDALYIPVAIKKDGGNLVSKVYDLSLPKAGVYYDASQSNPAKQQLWESSQVDGKPWIMFDAARSGGYAGAAVVPFVDYPVTLFLVTKYGGAPDLYRVTFGVSSSALNHLYDAAYYNGSIMLMLGPGQVNVNTNGLTLGQFTFLFDASAATARRKGVQVATGACGALTPVSNCAYELGASFDGSFNSGPIAFAAFIRRAITAPQRDAIENLLNTKYYPSTVA